MKETEEDTKKWENVPCSWIGRTNLVQMPMLPREIYTFNTIPKKYHQLFCKTGKLKKKNKMLVASQFQTSSSMTKLSSSRQYGTGTKTDTQVNGTE